MSAPTASVPVLKDAEQELTGRPSLRSRALHSPTFMAGATLTTTIVALALLAPVIGRYSPVSQDLLHTLAGPSAAHWLGTDELGRDIWSRLLYAGRTDLQVGVLAVLFPFSFGVFIGTVCGYFGGGIDTVVMRIVDIVLAFPFYVLIIALVFVVGVGTHGIYIAFGLTDWVIYARTTRSATMVARSLDWVAAAEGGGLSQRRRAVAAHPAQYDHPGDRLCHVRHRARDTGRRDPRIPRSRDPAPAPDWGAMISDGQNFIQTNQWMAAIPGMAVVLTGVGLSLLGDGLADILRPE